MCDIFRFSVLIDMGWKVFLPDRYIRPVENKIREIAGSLGNRIPNEGGLIGGKAGLACFYAYYADWSGDRVFDSLVADLIEQALNPASGHVPELRFSSGMSGVTWLIHNLSANGLSCWDTASVFDELDTHLYTYMISEMKSGHYDYLHGALGVALYFLRQPKNERYRIYLTELLSVLSGIANREHDGALKWISVLDEKKKKEGYNLSLSHGMASVMLILSKIHAEGIAEDATDKLIRGGLKYIDKQKLPPGKSISAFPSWALESMEEDSHSRLAWCYGDLGIGLAYLRAGDVLASSAYQLDGLNLLLETTKRREPGDNHVFDAGICHGAAGLALVYNVLYQETELNSFKDASLYWLDLCLGMASHDDGIAGYKAWHHPDFGGWKASSGLLDGAAGIGLSLLSFVSERKPEWAASLLVL